MNKLQLVILIGNIGSGKTTQVKECVKEGYSVICRDDIRTMLGGGIYKFDVRTEPSIRLAAQTLLRSLMLAQLDIVVDETNVTKRGRKQLIDLGKAFGYSITGIEMPRLSKVKSVANRAKDNLRDYTIEKWGLVWEKFNQAYQKPTLNEGFDMLFHTKEKICKS